MKKKIFVLSFSLLVFLSAKSEDSFKEFENFFEDSCPELTPPTTSPLPGSNCFPAIDILKLITPENINDPCIAQQGVCQKDCIINAPAILQEDLYLKTTGPVTRRSLLDEPSLRYYCLEHCPWNFSFTPFYNYSPRVFFTKNSPFIQTYIDLTNENIINEISDALRTACLDVDVPGVLGLFKNMKLQQHRAGAFFGICKTFCDLSFSFQIPLYYLIDHFFLTDEEIETIENSPFLEQLAIGPSMTSREQSEKFGRKHLVADRVGLGDSRLIFLKKIYQNPCINFWFGLQTTLPTAVTIDEGIIGGKFNPFTPPPPFNIKKLFELYFCTPSQDLSRAEQQILNTITNFFIGSLDRLTTILFDAPLGNGGHFGFGPQFDLRIFFNECWSLHTYAVLEGFIKHKESRFFLAAKNPKDFRRDYRSEEEAEENLRFLNDQIINTFFPEPFTIPVRPGIITKLTQTLIYHSCHWNGFLGFDFWHQRPEKLFVNKELIDNFDVQKATRSAAEQGKIYLGFGYCDTIWNDRIAWSVNLRGDGAVFHKGIGENYTLALRFGIDF